VGPLFVSGQPGVDPATGEAVGDSFEQQVRQVFRNLDMVLRAGDNRLDLVVNTTVLVADVSNSLKSIASSPNTFQRFLLLGCHAGASPARITNLDRMRSGVEN
jgi:enamine deaminase RidA (YjgF/YER057c/UK114 family)